MLNKANLPWNCVQLKKMFSKGSLFFGNVVQRSLVWEPFRKCGLIHSLIEGWPVPPFYARRVDGKIYDMLDGKQRINTIVEFMNDGYALEGIPPIKTEEGAEVDVNGMKYSELPEEMRDAINNYSLIVYYFENLSDEEARIMFNKLNSGKPLSAKEKNIANCVDISSFAKIGQHQLFDVALSDKAKEGRKQIPILVKMYAMLNDEPKNISFESKNFNELISSTRSTDEQRKELVTVLDKFYVLYNLFEENEKVAKKKMVSETHLVSLTPFIKKAIEENISDDLLKSFIVSSYNMRSPVSARYMSNCSAGSAKCSSIIARDEELRVAWNNFFAEDESQIVPVEHAEETSEGAEEEGVDTSSTKAEDDVVKPVEAKEEHRYGMRLRGFAPGTFPEDGFVEREDSDTEKYYDILVYSRELTDEEINAFELDRI